MISSLVLLLISSSLAMAVGFKNGNRFTATAISGQVTIACAEPGSELINTSFNCRDNVLEPSPYDNFNGPSLTTADSARLFLKAQHADGTVREKTASYNGTTGVSGVVNLWIKTLFQVPLLAYGENQIHFVIQDSGSQVLSQGDFTVNVDRGNPRVCQSTYYNSSDAGDCSSQYSVCQRYFEQFNNCR